MPRNYKNYGCQRRLVSQWAVGEKVAVLTSLWPPDFFKGGPEVKSLNEVLEETRRAVGEKRRFLGGYLGRCYRLRRAHVRLVRALGELEERQNGTH